MCVVCMYVCVYESTEIFKRMYIVACICGCKCTCVCVRESSLITLLSFRQSLSLNPELTEKANLTSQLAPEVFLTLSSKQLNYS